VCDALGECAATALASLNLSGNELGPAGGDALARTLPHLPALQTVDLSECGLGDGGWAAVAAALGGASGLTRLNLRDFAVEDEALLRSARAAVAAARGLPASVRAEGRHEHRLLFALDRDGCACDECCIVSRTAGLGYWCGICCYDLCLRCAGRLGVAEDDSDGNSSGEADGGSHGDSDGDVDDDGDRNSDEA
jgi:hypothetical protein